MDQLGAGAKLPEITEEQLLAAQPAVRYQVLMYLDSMYQRVDERIREDADGTRPMDPRFLELGIRIVKEMALHYRLNRPAPLQEEDADDPSITGIDRKALIMEQLQILEAKQRERGEQQQPAPAGQDVVDAELAADPGTSR